MKKSLLALLGVTVLTLGACADERDNKAVMEVTTTSDSTEVVASESEQVSELNSVIYDNGGITVTLHEVTTGGMFGSEISYTITNSTDKTLTISARDVSVNDQMDDMVSIYSELPSGKTDKSTGYFEEDSVIESGTVIEGNIHVINENYETIAQAPFSVTLQ